MGSIKTRLREVGDRYCSTLLNSLTLDQLRTAVLRIKQDAAPIIRSRNEALAVLETSGLTENGLNEILLNIEAKSPSRHAAVAQFSGPIPSFGKHQLFKYFAHSVDNIQFRPVYMLSEPDSELITFEHYVDVKDWVNTDDITRSLVSRTIRHPIIVHFQKKIGVAIFYYPGFSQGTAAQAKDRLKYERVISSLASLLTYNAKTQFSQFPIARAIRSLEQGDSPNVRIISTDINASGGGRVSLDSPNETSSVVDLLYSFLKPHVNDKTFRDLKKAIGTALDYAQSDSFVAYWCKEKVITRIKLWSIACEFMFIWNATDSSFRSIREIISVVVGVARQFEKSSTEELWSFIINSAPDTVFSQSELVSRSSLSPDEVTTVAIRGVETGILKYVFRLKTREHLVEAQNKWRRQADYYRRTFLTVSGSPVDGRDPSEIEVGFIRVSREDADNNTTQNKGVA